MDMSAFLSEVMGGIVSFVQGNTIIAIVIALILLYLIFRRTKLFIGLLCLVLIVALLFYLIGNLAGSGSERKKKLLDKEQTESESQ